jgi:hypothetical protein
MTSPPSWAGRHWACGEALAAACAAHRRAKRQLGTACQFSSLFLGSGHGDIWCYQVPSPEAMASALAPERRTFPENAPIREEGKP